MGRRVGEEAGVKPAKRGNRRDADLEAFRALPVTPALLDPTPDTHSAPKFIWVHGLRGFRLRAAGSKAETPGWWTVAERRGHLHIAARSQREQEASQTGGARDQIESPRHSP